MGLTLFEVAEGQTVIYRTGSWLPPAVRPYRRRMSCDAVHRVSVAHDETALHQTLSTLAVILALGDTGPGIAAAHPDRIFERFYRVDDPRSRETGGVGLGLAIARWAVEAKGGRIEPESEEGKGSTFRIVLLRT